MARITKVVPNALALRTLLYGPQSGLARDMARRAVKVQNAARLNASGRRVEGANNPEGRGPNVDTGRLRSSIAWELRETADGIGARVGTNVEYGYYLETGLRGGRTYPFLKPALKAAAD
jgi:hypothetical protein